MAVYVRRGRKELGHVIDSCKALLLMRALRAGPGALLKPRGIPVHFLYSAKENGKFCHDRPAEQSTFVTPCLISLAATLA